MSTEFPNEPVGATNFHNWGHNLLTGGGWYDAYGGFTTSIISDATAPLSPNNVLQQRFPSGGVGGNIGGGGNLYTFPTFYPQGVFYAFWMKLDANYEHHPSGTKVAWIHTRNGNSPQNNNLICMVKSSGGSLAHPMISWQWANGQPDNSHLGFVGSGYIESDAGQASTISRIRYAGLKEVNTTSTGRPISLATADATPSMAIGNWFIQPNGSAQNVTAYDGLEANQTYYVRFSTANTTLVDGSNLQLAGSTNYNPPANTFMTFYCSDGTALYEVSRSAN